MWRSKLVLPYSKTLKKYFDKSKLQFSLHFTEKNKNGRFGVIACGGLAFVGAIVYALHKTRFKLFLENNMPYIDRFNIFFSNGNIKQSKTVGESLQEDLDQDKSSNSKTLQYVTRSLTSNSSNPDSEKLMQKLTRNEHSKNNKYVNDSEILPIKQILIEDTLKTDEIKEDIASYEDDDEIQKIVLKLKKTLNETISAYRLAIKFYDKEQNEALEFSDYNIAEVSEEKINDTRIEKETVLNFARKKTAELKILFENLESTANQLSELDSYNSLAKLASKCLLEFQKAESKRIETDDAAREASEFEKILEVSKELLEKGLPNKFRVDQDKSEDDINFLLLHAYNIIENLQKQIAKLKKAEKVKVYKTVKNQKMLNDLLTHAENQGCLSEVKKILENILPSLKADFKAELYQQLLLQVTAHTEHLRKSLELQEEELKEKHKLELEQVLLNQKEAFILETSQNLIGIRGMTEYLRTMNECNKSGKLVQALWLTCQSIYFKIKSENLRPLAKDVENIKSIIGGDNDFVCSVIDSIPDAALDRGIFTIEILKQRFEKVKETCKKVALIDENNDSLYRYFLSYLQSFLIIDVAPTGEFDANIDCDTSQFDTFEILRRVTYFLNAEKLEQSLYYANQLKAEPRAVAKDWINELTYLLEIQLAFKALLTYSEAISIQAYH